MICIVNDTPVSFAHEDNASGCYGGTASFLSGFLKYLSEAGEKPKLMGNFDNFPERLFVTKAIKASSNYAFLVKLFWYLITTKSRDLGFTYYCHRPDHLAVALLSKGKHVVHLHGQPHTTINKGRGLLKRFFYNILERYAIPRADLIIATDKITAKLYCKLYPDSAQKILIIPTGVDLTEFSPDDINVHFPGVLPKTHNLVFIGRLAYPKQLEDIISAFSIAFSVNSSLHLWIAGTGPDEQNLKFFSAKLSCSDNIHFTGHLSRGNVKRLIHSSIGGILISRNEGSPMVVKEFLACGKPVIVNDVGDLSQYVHNGVNGFIVDPVESQIIANAINEITRCGSKMAQDCRASMQQYEQDLIFEQLHKSLLGIKKGS
jgi:glycosyltransferase involved in cell wall biosynthesis